MPDSASDELQLAKSKRSSEGNLSQNSPQSVADLNRTTVAANGNPKFRPDGVKRRFKTLKVHQNNAFIGVS